MAQLSLKYLLALFLGSMLTRTVLTCSCLGPTHIQTEICRKNFVAKVKIKSMHPEGYEFDYNYEDFFDEDEHQVIYTANVIKEYKREDIYKDKSPVEIVTGRSGALCGVKLNVGSTYIIGGNEGSSGVSINSCTSIVANPNTMDRDTLRFIKKGRYDENCECQVEVCSEFSLSDEVCPSGNAMSCYFDDDDSKASCYYNKSYCFKKGDGCKWKRTKAFRNC